MNDNDAIKQAMREVLTEWLDKKYAELGRWTVRGLTAGALGGAVILILWAKGH